MRVLNRKKILRLKALITKEFLQILRDPSAIIIAFILPIILTTLFATAVSLDINKIPLGFVQLSHSKEANDLYTSFSNSTYFKLYNVTDEKKAKELLIEEKIDGYVLVPLNLEARIKSNNYKNLIQVITDGAEPNTATFTTNYVKNVVQLWAAKEGISSYQMPINTRVWYNPTLDSKNFLVPGSIGIIMTMIGTLLTALVIAREWERGTMEALFSTPTSITEILLGKLLPYFVLGLIATIISTLLAQFVFQVPFRGSWFALLCLSSAFLVPSLAQGLLISTLAKNQFVASIVALLSAFLPAFILSGFLFEIDSMPIIIQALCSLLAVKYYIITIQAVFLTGDIWSLFLPNIAIMLLIGLVLFMIARKNTHKSLEEI